MPQPVRPTNTVSTADWNLVGTGAHEALADDTVTTYLECPVSSSTTIEVGFVGAEVVWPVIGTVTVRVLARKSEAGGNTRSLSIAMVSGGNVVSSGSMNNLAETYAWGELAIPNVTAYSEPAPTTIQLTAGGQTGGQQTNRRGVRVAALEVTYPDIAYVCDGMGDINGDHCDYVPGQPDGVCPHLVVNSAANPAQGERKYACGLRNELPSWDAVHADPRYQDVPGSIWVQTNTPDCGEWMGGTRDMMDAILARGEITELEYLTMAQCCFARYLETPKRRGQARGWVNRNLGHVGKGG